jgi:hypothetical protein
MNFESPTQPEKIQEFLPVPEEGVAFDRKKAEDWINKEEDIEIKAIKRKLIDAIHHIPFSEFKESAMKVISEAVRKLARGNKKYALFFDYKPHSSKRWLYELNKNSFDSYPPHSVGYFTPSWERVGGNKTLHKLVQEEGIHTFFISDDAVYSGEQILSRQIEPILRFYETNHIQHKPEFVIAVPFVTNRFIKLIESLELKDQCSIHLHKSAIMKSISELLTDDEKRMLENKRNGALELHQGEPAYLGATATYFDHRVADDHSFSMEIKNALGLFATKPYANERSEYYKKEELEFNTYREEILKK